MPPGNSKGKSKAKEGRQSHSRNTTPSSVVSAAVSVISSHAPASILLHTVYLDIPTNQLIIPNDVSYEEILEKHGGGGGIPDPVHLQAIANDLNTLSNLSVTRGSACDGGMRKLSDRRKQCIEDEKELEQANREAEAMANLKRAAEDDELDRSRKGAKVKKRKDLSSIREERPLTHGAHGVARQDGLGWYGNRSNSPQERVSVSKEATPNMRQRAPASGSSSSLSPASQLQSPTVATHAQAADPGQASPTLSSSSDDSHQPPPAPSIPQYQTFGADPLAFDDPTIYHIRDVTPNMTDEEKKGIYGVASFPKNDLSDLVAGVPPDKDFSNAKPSNQVNANTFQSYLDPYLRPLTDEDMAFLKERGDRVTPFLIPPRSKKHYTEIWAEEDGSISLDASHLGREKLPANQPRGSVEQVDDGNLETDQNSLGPVASRLLSTLRYEHRAPPTESQDKPNGFTNGNDAMAFEFTNGDIGDSTAKDPSAEDRLAPATSFPESSQPGWKVPSQRLDYAQADERILQELRHLGFIDAEAPAPDYEGHFDDEIAERLRFLQAELKKQIIINGARKARILQIAQERMAHQEYSTILDDLDGQVQAAYLKRNRSLGKGKKNAKRPGGAGGGSHYAPGLAGGQGTARPGIGDQAKIVMERRAKWRDTITPIFGDDVTKVRGEQETIFGPEVMKELEQAERDRWDEEVGM